MQTRTPTLGAGWEKCPAVWTGGPAHFWYRRSRLGNRQWYAYNRMWGCWVYEVEHRRSGRLAVIR